MDSFQVVAEDTTVLETSHLVEELRAGAREMEMFPVLIGTQIAYFHDVDGGFNPESGHDIVNLIHRVQGPDSPPQKHFSDTIEIHLDDWFYNLSVVDIHTMSEYPDNDFVLSMKVENYMMGQQSFSEALSADIDKREQEFSPNNDK